MKNWISHFMHWKFVKWDGNVCKIWHLLFHKIWKKFHIYTYQYIYLILITFWQSQFSTFLEDTINVFMGLAPKFIFFSKIENIHRISNKFWKLLKKKYYRSKELFLWSNMIYNGKNGCILNNSAIIGDPFFTASKWWVNWKFYNSKKRRSKSKFISKVIIHFSVSYL